MILSALLRTFADPDPWVSGSPVNSVHHSADTSDGLPPLTCLHAKLFD